MKKNMNIVPDGLGDFLFIIDKRGVSSTVIENVTQTKWPALGQADSEVATLRINENIVLFTNGSVAKFQSGDSYIAGLFDLINSEDNTPSNENSLISSILQTELDKRKYSPVDIDGRFAYLVWNNVENILSIVTDLFHSFPLYYSKTEYGILVATDARLITGSKLLKAEVDPHALYHYLNFAYVPTPFSIYKEMNKVPTASIVSYKQGTIDISRYWTPTYAENSRLNEQDAAKALKDKIIGAVSKQGNPNTEDWGTFLSGGTDSSTVSGILAKQNKTRALKTFSIGFHEEGYDELEYAQLAVDRFNAEGKNLRGSAQDTLDSIFDLVNSFDEPFGNASAIPTYYCAKLAKEHGVNNLIAGDGGDEIFGGNERYAKDTIFSQYYHLPSPVKNVFSHVGSFAGKFDSRFFNRVSNFVNRASLPNPERFYLDDSFASDFFEDFLTESYRESIDRQESLEFLKTIYSDCNASSELHKLMYIDLKMAISENDLTKVNRGAKSAGVIVRYPYLDKNLVEFTGNLPAKYKVKGLQKRYLFKKAVSEILPIEISKKTKQGFGLPVSIWLREHKGFKELLNDTLLSPRCLERGYFEKKFIENLIARHQKGTWDYPQELWQLLMLELWHRENVDNVN
jgi:asparagine synthase (glutamine-hydrolysing)